MPGHTVSSKGSFATVKLRPFSNVLFLLEETEVKLVVDKIEKLIQEHDVIFLLFDTREGRWLPTVISTLHSKVIFVRKLGNGSFR